MKDIFPDRVETVKEKPLSKKDKLIILLYDFCQNRRRVELLAFTILFLMLYAMWNFVT